jgi:hypothetical protein
VTPNRAVLADAFLDTALHRILLLVRIDDQDDTKN